MNFRDELLKKVEKEKPTFIPPASDTRAGTRRIMKDELRMMEEKLGERRFGKRMCKEYGYKDSLANRYMLVGRAFALMVERGDSKYFEEDSND
jgi:hypothetical protein